MEWVHCTLCMSQTPSPTRMPGSPDANSSQTYDDIANPRSWRECSGSQSARLRPNPQVGLEISTRHFHHPNGDSMKLPTRLFTAAALLSTGAVLAAPPTVVTAANSDAKCFAPWAPGTKMFQYPAKKGPYRVALANGYIANTWRIQMIQTGEGLCRAARSGRQSSRNSRSSRPERTCRPRFRRSTTSSTPVMTRSSSTPRTRRLSAR